MGDLECFAFKNEIIIKKNIDIDFSWAITKCFFSSNFLFCLFDENKKFLGGKRSFSTDYRVKKSFLIFKIHWFGLIHFGNCYLFNFFAQKCYCLINIVLLVPNI